MAKSDSGGIDDVIGDSIEEQTGHSQFSTRSMDDVFELYEELLDASEQPKERVQIPKQAVPVLPDRFDRTLLADIPDDAVGSYRDMEAPTDSVHVHEFHDHWELHIDAFNPHYYPIKHAVADASLTRYTSKQMYSVTADTVGGLRRLFVGASRAGTKGTRTLGRYLFQSASAGMTRLRPSRK